MIVPQSSSSSSKSNLVVDLSVARPTSSFGIYCQADSSWSQSIRDVYCAVLSLPKGQRPQPDSYLTTSEIEKHLKLFVHSHYLLSFVVSFVIRLTNTLCVLRLLVRSGTWRFLHRVRFLLRFLLQCITTYITCSFSRTEVLNIYGRELIGAADGQFVMPTETMHALLDDCRIAKDELNVTRLEELVGVPFGRWKDCDLSRIDISSPAQYNLRFPSGNELSANDLWIPGGFTIGGLPEACVSRIKRDHYRESIIIDAKKRKEMK